MHIPVAAHQEWAEWIINQFTADSYQSAVKIQIPLQMQRDFFCSY
jgi:hypothetical protein